MIGYITALRFKACLYLLGVMYIHSIRKTIMGLTDFALFIPAIGLIVGLPSRERRLSRTVETMYIAKRAIRHRWSLTRRLTLAHVLVLLPLGFWFLFLIAVVGHPPLLLPMISFVRVLGSIQAEGFVKYRVWV